MAPSATTALLLGESGTGKELVAQAIHQQSGREHGPFVVVECSGLTESLFESELFGYEKGAFTGANRRKIGLVESASGGTLFLDEVGDIPLSLQVKLLRLLETGTFRRVGGVETLRADFRLIAATHRDLKGMVERGSFRRDLYYRLSVFPIHLPALRERRGDIVLLAETLLTRLAPGRAYVLGDEMRARLLAYDFPGNIRELRNIIERAILMADGGTLLPEHLPEGCPPQLEYMMQALKDLTVRNIQEVFNDVIFYRDETRRLFQHGQAARVMVGLRPEAELKKVLEDAANGLA